MPLSELYNSQVCSSEFAFDLIVFFVLSHPLEAPSKKRKYPASASAQGKGNGITSRGKRKASAKQGALPRLMTGCGSVVDDSVMSVMPPLLDNDTIRHWDQESLRWRVIMEDESASSIN